jgi:hypothetical protein
MHRPITGTTNDPAKSAIFLLPQVIAGVLRGVRKVRMAQARRIAALLATLTIYASVSLSANSKPDGSEITALPHAANSAASEPHSDFPYHATGKGPIVLRCTYAQADIAANHDTKPRIILNSVSLSFTTDEDDDMFVDLVLTNEGTGAISEDWKAYLTIDDAAGQNYMRRLLSGVDFRKLVPGKSLRFSDRFLAPVLRPGRYTIGLWVPGSDPLLTLDTGHNLLLGNPDLGNPMTGLNALALLTVAR